MTWKKIYLGRTSGTGEGLFAKVNFKKEPVDERWARKFYEKLESNNVNTKNGTGPNENDIIAQWNQDISSYNASYNILSRINLNKSQKIHI